MSPSSLAIAAFRIAALALGTGCEVIAPLSDGLVGDGGFDSQALADIRDGVAGAVANVSADLGSAGFLDWRKKRRELRTRALVEHEVIAEFVELAVTEVLAVLSDSIGARANQLRKIRKHVRGALAQPR